MQTRYSDPPLGPTFQQPLGYGISKIHVNASIERADRLPARRTSLRFQIEHQHSSMMGMLILPHITLARAGSEFMRPWRSPFSKGYVVALSGLDRPARSLW